MNPDQLERRVKAANRNFYDVVGADYEAVDGRRSPTLIRYVSEQLARARARSGPGAILDLGCGSGFVTRIATEHFDSRCAIDISPRILGAIDDDAVARVAGDADALPVRDGAFACVAGLAFLHHCYGFAKLAREVWRVLAPGGVFYADHDLDERFYARFSPLLGVYRRINDARGKYLARFPALSAEDYDYAEFHEDSIPTRAIAAELAAAGFSEVTVEHHWFGLTPIADRIFGKRVYPAGLAPLARIFAVK